MCFSVSITSERYRDLIGAADSISDMMRCCQQVWASDYSVNTLLLLILLYPYGMLIIAAKCIQMLFIWSVN